MRWNRISNDKFVIEDTILKEVNKRLRKVEIPEGVTSIGEKAFNGCTSLKTINFLGTRNQWKELKLKLDGNIIVKCSDE